jgi:hypothetical protein
MSSGGPSQRLPCQCHSVQTAGTNRTSDEQSTMGELPRVARHTGGGQWLIFRMEQGLLPVRNALQHIDGHASKKETSWMLRALTD